MLIPISLTPVLVNMITTAFLLLAGAWLLVSDLRSRAQYKRLIETRLAEMKGDRYAR
jgi:hypothetical protein